MSMPISNSLGVQLCMTSDYPNGAATYSPPVPRAPQYAPQHSSLRARPRSGIVL